MLGHTVMIQGTASHVGKSVITAALCRWLRRRGYSVAPFKAQNMSLNSAVTPDGGEIGRSQAFQAAACGIPAEIAMNPVLLKPMAGGRCQVILRGKAHRITENAQDRDVHGLGMEAAAESLSYLRSRFQVVVLEGMGSPVEINLKGRDAANMPVAALANSPVLLVGDIERGGVFASLAGTLELLNPGDQARVRGLLINKFHGDPAVLQPGVEQLFQRYGVPSLGVLPWLEDLRVDEEDATALPLGRAQPTGEVDILVPRLPGLSNFTDLAPLAAEPGVSVRYVDHPREWGAPQLVILPGSRSVAADLAWLRARGLAEQVYQFAEGGGRVIGLCGGFQMLGNYIRDPEGVESLSGDCEGLGLLNLETILAGEKLVTRVSARSAIVGLEGLPLSGYEIHHGETLRMGAAFPALVEVVRDFGKPGDPGASTSCGRVFGTYLHGLFDSPEFRKRLLQLLGWTGRIEGLKPMDPFDRLAEWFGQNTDTLRLTQLIEESPSL